MAAYPGFINVPEPENDHPLYESEYTKQIKQLDDLIYELNGEIAHLDERVEELTQIKSAIQLLIPDESLEVNLDAIIAQS